MLSTRRSPRIALVRPPARGKTIAYLSTYPPRECGLATFTSDLSSAITTLGIFARPYVIAVHDPAIVRGSYAKEVKVVLDEHDRAAYARAAEIVNNSDVALVSVQHEFGIFGTDSGKDVWDGTYILEFLRRVNKPVVTTLHTVIRNPNDAQRRVLREVTDRSERIVLMARNVRQTLESVYGIPREKMAFIHHGAPDVPFHGSDYFKRALGLQGREILMTFGLLSPNKGIEVVLEALRTVVPRHPEVMYLIVGATHPVVRRDAGEEYRRELQRLVRRYGLLEHVRFVNQYLTLNQLVLFLRATNIYLAPQLSPEQYVSGTLAYAAAFGKAIVATRFRYARTLLSRGRGILVPFKDSAAIADALESVLGSPQKKRDMEEAIYIFSRKMTWPNVASRYANLFHKVILAHAPVPPRGGTVRGVVPGGHRESDTHLRPWDSTSTGQRGNHGSVP